MYVDMKNKQLTRLKPESISAIKEYRKHIKRTQGKIMSINSAMNELMQFGWAFIIEHKKNDE